MLKITIAPAGPTTYRAYFDGELLLTSKTPLFSAARKLVELGYDPSLHLGMTRDGERVDLSGRISDLAGRVVAENEKIGPVFRPYKAYEREAA